MRMFRTSGPIQAAHCHAAGRALASGALARSVNGSRQRSTEPDLDETAEDQPVTWMEAHGLGDGRQLMIPGEAGTLPTLSFWLRRSTDQRLGVVSFVLGANRQVTEISFRRSKACME